MSDDKTPSVYEQLTSRIDKVKVYAAGATVTRVAHLQLGTGEIPEHVEMAGLPLALDDHSIRVRVKAELGTSTAIATDVRIGLAVPPRQAVQNSASEEEVREAKAVVRRLEDVNFVNPHPKSLSHGERDFEILLPFSRREKGLGDVSVCVAWCDSSIAARSAGNSSTCSP